jgi:hypothetical protein
MTAFVIIAIAGSGFVALVTLLSRLPSSVRRCQRMDDRKLVDMNVTAKMVLKRMRVLPFLLVVVFGISVVAISDPALEKGLLCVMLVTMFAVIGSRQVLWEMLRITTTEIEYRKFQQAREESTPGDAET